MEQYKIIDTHDLIAMCHIVDEFKQFERNLFSFVKKQIEKDKKSKNIYEACETIGGKIETAHAQKNHLPNEYRHFYDMNENVINTIKQYTDFSDFIYLYFASKKRNKYLNYVHNYLLRNKDKIDNILVLLKRLEERGVYKINFDENLDFSKSIYELNEKNRVGSTHANNWLSKEKQEITEINCLENIADVQSDKNGIIYYTTTNSCYKLNLKLIFFDTYKEGEYFKVVDNSLSINDLTINIARLDFTYTTLYYIVYNFIYNLKEKAKQEEQNERKTGSIANNLKIRCYKRKRRKH